MTGVYSSPAFVLLSSANIAFLAGADEASIFVIACSVVVAVVTHGALIYVSAVLSIPFKTSFTVTGPAAGLVCADGIEAAVVLIVFALVFISASFSVALVAFLA